MLFKSVHIFLLLWNLSPNSEAIQWSNKQEVLANVKITSESRQMATKEVPHNIFLPALLKSSAEVEI